ncbi:MAG: TIGR01777 family oxidoreductase [Nocardioidaceae bacterium]
MRIVLSGASGFLGTALRHHLTTNGHELVQLVRGTPSGPGEVRWDPYRGELDPAVLAAADAVVNLSGAPIAHWPRTSSYKRTLLDSRLAPTRTLADSIAQLDVDDKPALVNASGVNYYGGDRGDEPLDETSTTGGGFLCEMAQRWESATGSASTAGARVVIVRTAPVLAGDGGVLRAMALPFKLGVGGKLGSGRQWFPSVSLADYCSAVERLATDSSMVGPYNVVAPTPATNAELTAAIGAQLHRPTRLTVPAWAIKLALGEMATELLGSLKVRPTRLLEAGFTFAHPDIDSQLAAAL